MLFLGADHGGFTLKESLKQQLQSRGIAFEDCGAFVMNPNDDYPEFAKAVSKKVVSEPENMGILCCRSGAGMAIAANRFSGIRAVEAWNPEVAKRSRQHTNANVLCLAGDWLSDDQAWIVVEAWLEETFSQEERHVRRIAQLG